MPNRSDPGKQIWKWMNSLLVGRKEKKCLPEFFVVFSDFGLISVVFLWTCTPVMQVVASCGHWVVPLWPRKMEGGTELALLLMHPGVPYEQWWAEIAWFLFNNTHYVNSRCQTGLVWHRLCPGLLCEHTLLIHSFISPTIWVFVCLFVWGKRSSF